MQLAGRAAPLAGRPVQLAGRPVPLAGRPCTTCRTLCTACRTTRAACRTTRAACRPAREVCRPTREGWRTAWEVCRPACAACRATRAGCRTADAACRTLPAACRTLRTVSRSPAAKSAGGGRSCPWHLPARRSSFPRMSRPSLIGAGLYSLPEASRLIKIPSPRIRRWMEGYGYVSRGKEHRSPPIIQSSIGRLAGPLSLTFADLIEVRFLDAFLGLGVSWQEIRAAVETARELLNTSHPFSTKTFKTDGRSILAKISRRGQRAKLLNLRTNQWELGAVVLPTLFAGIEFDEFDHPDRWWPLTRRRTVVVDPQRAFGTPIVSLGAVPTYVLASSVRAEGSRDRTARLYEVPVRAVRDAVDFEAGLLLSK